MAGLALLLSAVLAVDTAAPSDRHDDSRGYVGVLVPVRSARLAADVAGTIAGLHALPGDRVAAGQILVRLEVIGLDEQIKAAAAQLAAAAEEHRKAAILLAEATRKITTRSAARDVFTEDELHSLRTAEAVQQAALDMAGADMAEKEALLAILAERKAATRIQAPFAGVVAEIPREMGAFVAQGTELARIVSAHGRLVRFAVPEDEIDRPVVGETLEVTVGATTCAARVRHVSPEVEEAAGVIVMEAEVDTTQARLDALPLGAVVRVRSVGD